VRALLLVAFYLSACAADPRGHAERIARQAGLASQEIQTGVFRLQAYVRQARARVLRVYIEGDGHAWLTRQDPSDDPTPHAPVALELAARDPAQALAYLARPCQFVEGDPACGPAFWTSRRYAEPVIVSLNQALGVLKTQAHADRLELVGYSGGGAVAVLLAARRSDVRSLRTVAANLDTNAWTARLGVTKLTLSLNPAESAPALRGLPQIHFVGDQDETVDPAIVRSFAARMGPSACLRIIIQPGLGHNEGWATLWPDLLALQPRCRR
jgi:poly(3-hydroxybutyrate) depolymerase